ncbi:MAG: hypothetical protein K2R98_24160 [Gemmataceae bacterium]|nr:hypothetical protein [Gemmataceae bacterium]
MVAEFNESGIHFRYPENWQLERQENEDGWSVSVQSPDTAFVMICLRDDLPSANQLADAALAALKEEYSDLEADECVESLAGLPAVGHDIRFFSLDLPNTCWTRSIYTANGTILVLCQINDLELPKNEAVLRAICASLKVEDE